MADIVLTNLDDRIVERLRCRARKAGHSIEGEVASILETVAKNEMSSARAMVDAIRRSLKNPQTTDSVDLIREARSQREHTTHVSLNEHTKIFFCA